MKNREFKALLESVRDASPLLTDLQRRALAAALGSPPQSEPEEPQKPEPALADHQPHECPHCQGTHLVRRGVYNRLQRYLCKDCGRTFNAATGTPLARLRNKELLDAYADCLAQGMSVRKTAKALGISVDKSFRWRHRALQGVIGHQPQAVAGILEVDETYMRYSEKGSRHLTRPARRRGGGCKGEWRQAKHWVPVLVGRARGQPYILDKVLERVDEQHAVAALKGAVAPGQTLVCTDGHAAYRRLGELLEVETGRFLTRHHGHVRQTFHVQNVNNYHEQIKTWIQRKLRGVATKYLPNYLAWHRMLKWNEDGLDASGILRSALGQQVVNI